MGSSRQVLRTTVCDVLGIEYPILQSGMGGVAGPALVAEVCNAGGLGILAGLLTAPDDLRAAISEVRHLTDRPFGVNLWLAPEVTDPVHIERLEVDLLEGAERVVNRVHESLQLPPLATRPTTVPELVTAAIDVVLDERVPVLSVAFGDPGPDLTSRLHDAGIRTVVMVTNSDDARRVARSGADVIVAQGTEAGGHRSHFTKRRPGELGDVGTLALVPEVADAVDVPVVAAGGIVDGRGVVAALALGAAGVLMGSRFLVTRESMAPEAHKKRLLEEHGERTVVTDTVTGRHARVVRNALTGAWAGERAVLPFPAQYIVNGEIIAAATRRDDADHLPLWASQAIGQLDDLPWARDVVADTVRDAAAILRRELPARVILE